MYHNTSSVISELHTQHIRMWSCSTPVLHPSEVWLVFVTPDERGRQWLNEVVMSSFVLVRSSVSWSIISDLLMSSNRGYMVIPAVQRPHNGLMTASRRTLGVINDYEHWILIHHNDSIQRRYNESSVRLKYK